MNLLLFSKSLHNLRTIFTTGFNRAVAREFIPAKREQLNIETSSICNLDCCICAYSKKITPKVVMEDGFFRDCIGQALEMGYRHFDFTPCTGDVFMDKGILDKLAYLDDHPGVRGYSFHTNFTVPGHGAIDRLVRLRKISDLHISVYGYDSGSFAALTRTPEKVYHRLVSNLEYLFGATRSHPLPLHLVFHVLGPSLRGRSSALIDVVERFEHAGTSVKLDKGLYNNWGGMVSEKDVEHLPVTVVGQDKIYKNGACRRLFTTLQITASGIVNGCACRDADATLRLGDLHEAPLREIVSSRNPEYLKLIDEQQSGNFRPVCRSCDFYSSIYHKSGVYRREGTRMQTLVQFLSSLG